MQSPVNEKSERLRGHGAGLLFALFIAMSFSLGDRALAHIEPKALNVIRFFCACIVTGVIALVLSPHERLVDRIIPRAPWRFLVLGSLMGIFMTMMFISLNLTTPVSTGAVFTLVPLLSAGFGFLLLREYTSPIVLSSLVIAGLGAVWVIFNGEFENLMRFDLGLGEALFFLGTVAYGVYVPMVKKLNRGDPITSFTFWTTVGTFAFVFIFGFPAFFATDLFALPSIVWITVAYLSTVTTAGTFFLLQYAAVRIPAGKAAAYTYMTPVWIILIEGVFGAGWVTLSISVGVLVIVLGLVILVLTPDK